jgi:5'-deoxynucleotidase YfbR-like HD superfamily hydrolase
MHVDGVTPESDTDHTVMLGVIACAFAQAFVPHLDPGKIAQFALIHDLVEVYAGDTPTIVISDEAREEKDRIEKAAHERIEREFGDLYPWIHQTITDYESLAIPEARFVKTMDKVMPAIVHLLSDGKGIEILGYSKAELLAGTRVNDARLKQGYGSDQPEVFELLVQLRKKYFSDY